MQKPLVGAEISKAQTWKMVQSLLEDRFKLKTHFATRELPVYVLEVGKNGARLQAPRQENCDLSDGPVSHGADARTPCGTAAISIAPAGTRIVGGRVSMTAFARILTTALGRQVIDKTGFTGTFDVDLVFSPDQATGRLVDLADGQEARDPNAVTIFTALQEQLGLKLEKAKGPVQVLIVDSVNKPSEN